MRVTSVIAGLLALVATLGVLSWAIRPSPTTQPPPEIVPVEESDAPQDEHPEPEPSSPKAEMFTSNPFTAASGDSLPKAVVDEETHNFGRLAIGATGEYDFTIRNEGEKPLMLAKGESTCKCTGFSLGTKEVAPGESVPIHLEWKPPHEASNFSQTAVVWTNDPDHPMVELKVEGAVVPVIGTIPQGTWTVGMISEGVSSTVDGSIACYLHDSFEIERVETSSEYVTVNYEPLEPDQLQQLGARAGYQLSCTVDSTIPVGIFTERVKVYTTLEEVPQVQFAVTGSRIGPFQVIGPGWTESRQLLSMGRCAAAKGKTTQISYFVSVPEGVEFEFGEPQITPPVVNVSVTRDESFSAGSGRQRYVVVIEAPPGITPGRWISDEAIKVVLPCNHPYSPHASFFVGLQAD